jgi:hypothetical protein
LFVSLTLRAERLGILEIELPAVTSASDLLPHLAHVGTCLAHGLRAVVPLSDVVEGARRHEPMALAAEMQWALVPIRAFDCAAFSIAGQLVPAYEVGGDMFDHALGKGHSSSPPPDRTLNTQFGGDQFVSERRFSSRLPSKAGPSRR